MVILVHHFAADPEDDDYWLWSNFRWIAVKFGTDSVWLLYLEKLYLFIVLVLVYSVYYHK